MPRFLSDEWLAALAGAAAGAGVAPDVTLAVEHVITGAPAGEVRYGVRIAGGKVEVVPGGIDTADARFTQDWDTAVAVHRGDLSAQDAFMTGRLEVTGDVRALIRTQEAVALLEEAFAGLRADTRY